MNEATMRSGALLGRVPTSLILLVGPVLTVLVVTTNVGSSWLLESQARIVLLVALLAWSPLLCSIPSILLQDARDAALPRLQGPLESLVRGVLLVPYLLLSARSTVRLEMALSLVGLGAAYWIASPFFA